MTGHTASVYSLAFSAESSLLVSGAADWTVRCWDVKAAGGLPTKVRENGTMVNGNGNAEDHPPEKDETESSETCVPFSSRVSSLTCYAFDSTDLMATFPTKRTPIINVQFTPRNLCLVAGPYLSPETR